MSLSLHAQASLDARNIQPLPAEVEMSVEVEQNLEVPSAGLWLKGYVARMSLDPTARRALLAIGDQAIVSGTRFLTTALIGRFCGPKELGTYALAFSLYSLTACTQEALVSLPFTIYGNRLVGDERRRFAGSSLAHYGMLSLTAGILLALVAMSLLFGPRTSGLAPVIGMLSITLPLACLVEFARRFCLARLDLPAVLAVDATMAALQTGGLVILAVTGLLSAVTAYGCVALAAMVIGSIWLFKSRRQFLVDRSRILADGLRNWRFSRWLVAGQVVFLIRGAAAPWLLVVLLDTSAAGTYAACETIVLLANPLLLAMNNILGPQASRAFVNGGSREVRRLVFEWTILIVIATGIMCGVFLLVADSVLLMLFGGTYAGHQAVLVLMALAIAAEGFGMAASNGLWAIEQPRVNLIAISTGSITALSLSAALIPLLGLSGAACGSLAGRFVTSTIMFIAFFKLARRGERVEARS